MKATNAQRSTYRRENTTRDIFIRDSARLVGIRASRRLAPPRVGQRVARASGVKHALRRHATPVRFVEVRVASPRTDRRASTRAPPREPNRTKPYGAHPDLPTAARSVPRPRPRPRPASLTRPSPLPARPLLTSRFATRHAPWACPPEASTPPRFGHPRAGGSPTRKRGSETRSWVSRLSASPARSSSTTHGRWSSAPSRPRDAFRPRRGAKTSRRGPPPSDEEARRSRR